MKIGKIELATELADTHFSKARGLMFRRRLDHALVFLLDSETVLGAIIHSFFVFFPFDIVWLNNDRKIVDMAVVRPFRLFVAPKKRARYFLELPAGTIRRAELKLGQKIRRN